MLVDPLTDDNSIGHNLGCIVDGRSLPSPPPVSRLVVEPGHILLERDETTCLVRWSRPSLPTKDRSDDARVSDGPISLPQVWFRIRNTPGTGEVYATGSGWLDRFKAAGDRGSRAEPSH